MPVNRRDFLKSILFVPAAMAVSGGVVRAMAGGGGTRNVVFIDLRGGNDGLNTIVPYGMNGGTYYSEFRPTLHVTPNDVLPVDASLGFHPSLAALKAHYDAGRLAIVNGVGYPSPNFSHDVAQRIWQTGDPTGFVGTGWLARFLDQLGVAVDPNAVSVHYKMTGLLDGSASFVPNFYNLDSFSFPFDNHHWSDIHNRRDAYTAIASGLSAEGAHLGTMSQTTTSILDLIDTFQALPTVVHAGAYPEGQLGDALKLVVRLLSGGLGLRFFHVPFGGFDTHADQEKNGFHSGLLSDVSVAIDGLYTDLVALGLEQETLVVVFSEFGRTVYENGSHGTDHGTVGPVLVLGHEGCVTGGMTTPHPSMDPADLDPSHGELPRQADFRDVFGTVVDDWLGGSTAGLFPGHTVTTLPFIS